MLIWEEMIGDRDFGIIQVNAELKPWKWIRFLKEKLDSKKNERTITEHGEIFTIIIQETEKKTPIWKQKFDEKE